MTSPASGAGSAADLPDYAPTTRSAQSETGRAASPGATAGGSSRLGLALLVIATAQLMVVLDATIVNVALPHVQRALGFSGSGLEWVVNAYAVTFGGLLLLGGRAGDIFGRRRTFVFGLLLFSGASLIGGFATSEWWLLTARAVQGVGGAVIAPTALALITTNFPEGAERNRAFGVYASMAGAGAAVGLLLGGILTTYASWRWVLFVNVPIGIVVAAAAPRVLAESPRRPGRIDVAGAITGTGGIALLVYGLSKAATGPDGVSHWGDAQVLASLAASVLLLVSFVLIERRSSRPLLPLRVLRRPQQVGFLPDHVVHRHRAFRLVLLPHPVHAERARLQRDPDGHRLPAVRRRGRGRLRAGLAAGAADRRPTADRGRRRHGRGRDVLVFPADRARRLTPATCSARSW